MSLSRSSRKIKRKTTWSRSMTGSAGSLEDAANEIMPQFLDAAKIAIIESCQEYIRWVHLFSCRLEFVAPQDLHKLARAFSLTLLGHLPTRPETCPFCIQYGHDRACTDCGYAATHGRCDADDSAFSLFIESYQELGRLIFQETEGPENSCSQAEETRQQLLSALYASRELAELMQERLASLSALQLMQEKQKYITQMIGQLPLGLFCDDVTEQFRHLQEQLKRYW